MKSLFYSILLALAMFVPASCISDDISTNSSDRLSFSRDTVSFDIVFTDLGTPTARLQVFNRNKKGLNISEIRFENPQSPFSVNVDGVSGTTFHDVEIRGQDSLYVFIECYLPETSSRQPQLVEDKLLFKVNGIDQAVVIEAWGRNVIRLRNLTVTDHMTLTAEQPYVIFDSLKVAPGARLSIMPGAQLLFHDKASLTVDGTLEAVGQPDKLIDMRGDRLDDVLPDVGYDILAGQWLGIRLREQSRDNRLEYVNMRSTTDGLVIDSCAVADTPKLTLVNSWLHNSQASAIKATGGNVNAYGCIFSEAANAVVSLKGGEHEFINCTISNYYLYSAISEPLLTLRHALPDEPDDDNPGGWPLMRANFENCIIYGLGTDINTGDLSGSNVYLRYSLLKSQGSNDDHFIDCLWDADPLFMTIREDYIFDYRLKEGSPAINAGQAAFVQPLFQRDIYGLDRINAGGKVNMGALAGFVADDADNP